MHKVMYHGNKKKVLRVLSQTGHISNLRQDRSRRAFAPGKRISRNGNEYWETRKNRSDRLGYST